VDDFKPDAPWCGHRFGPADSPDEYRLKEPVDTQASEGQIWQATTVRQNKGSTGQVEREEFTWAVKIVDARRRMYQENQTLREALEELAARYRSAKHETTQMRGLGIVGPSDVFIGRQPHPLGDPGGSPMLYVISPWIEGDNLLKWRRGQPPPQFDEICGLLGKLATIIDAFARWGPELVHRDIAPENVMVDPNGQPHLIDFTYARPPDSAAATEAVRHRGYTPPEALFYEYGLAGDRYSFGAVAFFLLSGVEPPMRRAAEESHVTLVDSGLSAEVATHVAALLAEDPGARPKSLTDWTARLRKLGSSPVRSGRYSTLAMTVDGTSARVITAASESGASRVRLATGLAWQLAPDRASPSRITSLASVTDGSGSPVTFALTGTGTAFAHKGRTWTALGPCLARAGLAAIRGANGEGTAHVVAPATNMLDTITVGLDGRPRRAAGRYRVGRVLSATADRDGSSAVIVLLPTGELGSVTHDGVAEISPEGAFAAAACLDQWGELRCYRVLAGSRDLSWFDRSTGRWDRVEGVNRVQMPFAAHEIACAGHREGVTVAIAGTGGVWVASHGDHELGDWRQLANRPSNQLGLAIGSDWLLRLSVLVEGRAGLAVERRKNGWPSRLTIL
jgi:serine/threonine protein kinase